MSDREDTKARALKNTRFERAAAETKRISKSRAPVWETLNVSFDKLHARFKHIIIAMERNIKSASSG